MKKHIRNFLKHYNICEQEIDSIMCMIPKCDCKADDIHHVIYKSQGGKDTIDNLLSLCRPHHDAAHFKVKPYLSEEYLLQIVQNNLNK